MFTHIKALNLLLYQNIYIIRIKTNDHLSRSINSKIYQDIIRYKWL